MWFLFCSKYYSTDGVLCGLCVIKGCYVVSVVF